MRVPPPRGLAIASVPPCAETRSSRPGEPGAAPGARPADAVVGDAHLAALPFSRVARSSMRDAEACLTAFVIASQTTK